MNKSEYLEFLETHKKSMSELTDLKNRVKSEYIEQNKPCEKGDVVEITRSIGKVTGTAETFGILENDEVYITAISNGSKKVYFSKPYISVRKVEI